MDRPRLRLHGVKPRTRANGPGVRYGVWFQGCTLACPGCFNPDTHPSGQPDSGDAPAPLELEVAELVARIAAEADAGAIEGVTLSGGEPFQQPRALLELCRTLRAGAATTSLSILVFSGYTRREIEAQPLGPEILAALDVLVDGRYVEARRLGRGLRGSSNQKLHLLSDRYTAGDLETTPVAEIEVAPDGTVTLTGVDPVTLGSGPAQSRRSSTSR
jgi:anaerobic ribonucleoside-triphosphate reductase activating protein